ncbi:FAD-dependent oxidoreductase [Pseudonocardia ailaonensis]|uniref:FAD-dependent oxidoreductase n=1 Tax=Pseudonocardia ailaonensis TaxID=367279 RepID=A0ABN2NG94_9PSEU
MTDAIGPALAAALSPTELGGVPVRNRIFVPGHTTNFAQDNLPTPRHVAYHRERARGGVGLIITEAVRVHPTSAGRHISLGCFDERSVPAFAAIADAVHAEGAALFAQIMHAGRQANGDATRTVAWSASPLPWNTGAHTPHAMGRKDLDTVVTAFGAAAARLRRAGVDGFEVHAGHGHLLQQFLSPATNQRSDSYGGPLANRMRLTHRVLEAVRTAAPDLPVGLRVSADEWLDGGLDPAQVVEIVGILREAHPLAYVHVSHSAYHGSWSLSTQMADMSFPHAPFRHHAALFRKALPGLPVLAVCRLDSLAEAAELIADGEADLVGLARPHIADPHLVRKTIEGRAHEIRTCLACNQGCISRVEQSLPISCLINPEVGAEREWLELAARPPARGGVLVVGGGPAGLEAALSAHRAGHEVTIAEAGPDLGGQIRIAARVPGRERLGLLVAELERDVRAAGVTVHTDHRVTASEVVAGDWADVVLATGSRPARRTLPGTGGPRVADLHESVALLDAGNPGGAVVVLDDDGGWAGASLAEAFAALGAEVHLVSPAAALSPRITTYSKLALTRRFADLHVRTHLMRKVVDTGPGRVTLLDPLGGTRSDLTGVALVVDAGIGLAEDTLYRALDDLPEGPRLHLAGDAHSPRSALEAVYEGRLAGSVLTSEKDPEPILLALSR